MQLTTWAVKVPSVKVLHGGTMQFIIVDCLQNCTFYTSGERSKFQKFEKNRFPTLSGNDFRIHNSYPWLYNPVTQELYSYRESIEKDNPTLLIAWQSEMARYNRTGNFDSRIFDQYFSEEIRLRRLRICFATSEKMKLNTIKT